MLCLCCGICRLWLKIGTWKYHGCTGRFFFLLFFFQRYESFPSPKTAYSYLLKYFSFVCNGKVIRLCFIFFFHKVNLEKPWEHFLFVKCFFFLLSNDQAASIRVARLCLINLALSNHHDLQRCKVTNYIYSRYCNWVAFLCTCTFLSNIFNL